MTDKKRVYPFSDLGPPSTSPPPPYREKEPEDKVEQKGPLWSWPPGEVTAAFSPLPPYPAGPNLSNVKYPRDVSGPSYQCPECEQKFLFHRLMGIVVCPFCQKTITVGRYNRKRSLFCLVTGATFLIVSAIMITLYFILFPKQPYVLISVLMVAIVGFIFLIKAAHTKNQFPDAIRIDQY